MTNFSNTEPHRFRTAGWDASNRQVCYCNEIRSDAVHRAWMANIPYDANAGLLRPHEARARLAGSESPATALPCPVCGAVEDEPCRPTDHPNEKLPGSNLTRRQLDNLRAYHQMRDVQSNASTTYRGCAGCHGSPPGCVIADLIAIIDTLEGAGHLHEPK